jgi:orotate phosphoribosyltransferase
MRKRMQGSGSLGEALMLSRPALERSDPRWKLLHSLIAEHSLHRGEFVLASGRTSNFHFQLGQTLLLPEGATLVGEIVVEYMREHDIDCLGGLELGATTVAAVTAAMSQLKGWPVHAFFVRKEPKSHGAQQKIDGHLRTETEVLAVDDVATTGNSILDAIKDMNGASVRRALVVLDREEGATEKLATHGIELASIFKKSDFSL